MSRIKRKPQGLVLVTHKPTTKEHPKAFKKITGWRKPRRVTIKGDLFHPDVTDNFIANAFLLFLLFNKHRFELTTRYGKRWQKLRPDMKVGRSVRVVVQKMKRP